MNTDPGPRPKWTPDKKAPISLYVGSLSRRANGEISEPDEWIGPGSHRFSPTQVSDESSRGRFYFYIRWVALFPDAPRNPLVFIHNRSVSGDDIYVNNLLINRPWLLRTEDVIRSSGDTENEFIYNQIFDIAPWMEHRSAERTDFRSREIANRFKVSTRVLGRTRNSVVYLAWDDLTKQQREKIDFEPHLMASFHHRNILPFKAAFISEHNVYMFMNLAPGGDMGQILRDDEDLDDMQIRWIIRQVLQGLLYLHGRGLIHRDIKPGNLLCATGLGLPKRIIISDFGLCKSVGEERANSRVGTDYYRAPEVLIAGTPAGRGGYGTQADIYSLGVTTLRLFLGSQPTFEPMSQADIDDFLQKAFSARAPRTAISDRAADFIRACLLYQEDARLTAQRALEHPWLREPKADCKQLDQWDEESIKLFAKQEKPLKPYVKMIGNAAEIYAKCPPPPKEKSPSEKPPNEKSPSEKPPSEKSPNEKSLSEKPPNEESQSKKESSDS